jgi:hypothetical protein
MFTGLAQYFTYPKISFGELTESTREDFTLEPNTNETVSICWSDVQLLYLSNISDLVLNNSVSVEVSSSGPVTLYKQDYNTIVKLAENITFYNYILLDTGAETKLIIVSEVSENIDVNVSLNCSLRVRTVDLTLQRKGFRIFVITLLITQILSLIINKCSLVPSLILTIAYKFSGEPLEFKVFEKLYKLMNSIPEFLIIIFRFSLYYQLEKGVEEIFYPHLRSTEIHVVEMSLLHPTLDAVSRVNLSGLVASYFYYIVSSCVITIGYFSIFYKILKKRDEILKMHEVVLYEAYRDVLNRSKKTWALYSLGFLSCYSLIALLSLTPLVFYVIYAACILLLLSLPLIIYRFLRYSWRTLQRRGLGEFFSDYVEINSKMAGLFVISFIAMFVIITVSTALFFTLLDNIVHWELLPRPFLEMKEETREDALRLVLSFGGLQVYGCAFAVTVYWVAKIVAYKFEPRYRIRVLKDIAFSLVVTGISEYLLWSYYYFTLHQSYTPFNPPISLLIGLASSIVEEMFREL